MVGVGRRNDVAVEVVEGGVGRDGVARVARVGYFATVGGQATCVVQVAVADVFAAVEGFVAAIRGCLDWGVAVGI
jgi:hypothetical protein